MSDVDDAVSLHALGVGAVQPESLHIAGVPLVQVVGPHPTPCITLDALQNALGQLVVIERQVIRLQQLQGERYAGQVGVVGNPPAQLLRQRFTVSQPGAADQPLHLRSGQLAGGLRPQRPFRPARLDLCGELQMHIPRKRQRDRFNADARPTDYPLFQPVKQAGDQVVVLVQVPGLLAERLACQLHGQVGAVRLAFGLMGAAGPGCVVGANGLTRSEAADYGAGAERLDDPIYQGLHTNVASAYPVRPPWAAAASAATRRSHSLRPSRIWFRSAMVRVRPPKVTLRPSSTAVSASRYFSSICFAWVIAMSFLYRSAASPV